MSRDTAADPATNTTPGTPAVALPPGAIPPPDDLDWSRGVSLWGPKNPLPAVRRRARPWGLRQVWAGLGIGVGLNLALGFAFLLAASSQIANDPTIDPAKATTELLQRITSSGPFLVGSLLALWVGFLGAPLYATYRRGARSMKIDFGLTFRWKRDLTVGVLLAVGLRVAETGLVTAAQALGVDMETADNSSWLVSSDRAVIWTVLLALSAAVGGPIVEEIFFRGLTLRAFMKQDWAQAAVVRGRSLAAPIGIVASSALFGVLHTTAFTSGGVFVMAVTGLLGVALAVTAVKTKTLGAPIIAHCLFNSIAVVLLIAS